MSGMRGAWGVPNGFEMAPELFIPLLAFGKSLDEHK